MDTRYQVFVSSTFMDLEEEREIAVQTLMKMNCIPSGMELFPAADIEQFEFIKTVINDCDYYLLIIGGRYGTLTDEGISYTEKEYDYAIKKGIKVIAFLHKNPEDLSQKKSEVSEETIAKLNAFRKKVSNGRLVDFWENKDQLAGMVALGMLNIIRMYPAIGWIRANKTSSVESLEEINALQKRNRELEIELNSQIASTSQSSSISTKLAALDSSIKVELTDKRNTKVTSKHNLIWLDILKSISSIIFESVSEYQIKMVLLKLCLQGLPNPDNFKDDVITEESFNLIKIQFYALDYISFEYELDDQYIIWKATKKGKKAILEMIAITDESK